MTTVITNSKIPLKTRVLHVLRLAIATVARFFFRFYYGREGQKIPLISDDILKNPAVEIARLIRKKEVTSVEVIEACIRRIKEVNSVLNCFVEDRFDAALKEAREADELVRSGGKSTEELYSEKPFLGVPFTTKDCIAVKGLHQTSGVTMRRDYIAEEDAEVIKLLKNKGAIVIGLTNVPELCMWWETHNQIHGRTNNAYNTTRIVGGSSGGEGCLQSVGGSIFGVGSDIGGSIRLPAFFNGIHGHKPTRNIVSIAGQYPIPHSEMQASFLGIGPMTRYAVDLRPLMEIMAGDNSSKLKLNEPVDLENIKVYYQFESGAPFADRVDPAIITAMHHAVGYLIPRTKMTEEKKIGLLQKSAAIWFAAMKTEKRFGQYIMENEGIGKICFEILKNIFGLSNNTFIALMTSLFDYTGVKLGEDKHKHFLKLRDDLENEFKEMLGDDGVFLYPTHPTPAPYHNEPLLKAMNFSYTAIINSLGFPATALPFGLTEEGVPIGIQVIANHNNDRLCFAIAEKLERMSRGWVEPQTLS